MSGHRRSLHPLVLLLTAVLSFGASSCCAIPFDLTELDSDDDDDWDDDEDDGPSRKSTRTPKKTPIKRSQLDLGTAAYPKPSTTPAAEHRWWTPRLTPRHYQLGYQLDPESSTYIHQLYHDYAKRVGHHRINENRFRWRPPKRCFGGLSCVYEQLEAQGRVSIEPIAALFKKRAQDANLSTIAIANLVISFAQEIRYEIPKKEPFGVLPPALVVAQKRGDCDSKSLLIHMILRTLGIRSILISSRAHAHTMLGIMLPTSGKTFTHRGSRYAFVESTAKRSPIGHIAPRLLRPNDWRAQVLTYQKPPQRGAPPPPAEPEAEHDGRTGVWDTFNGQVIHID